jgi:hypothetical protein
MNRNMTMSVLLFFLAFSIASSQPSLESPIHGEERLAVEINSLLQTPQMAAFLSQVKAGAVKVHKSIPEDLACFSVTISYAEAKRDKTSTEIVNYSNIRVGINAKWHKERFHISAQLPGDIVFGCLIIENGSISHIYIGKSPTNVIFWGTNGTNEFVQQQLYNRLRPPGYMIVENAYFDYVKTAFLRETATEVKSPLLRGAVDEVKVYGRYLAENVVQKLLD